MCADLECFEEIRANLAIRKANGRYLTLRELVSLHSDKAQTAVIGSPAGLAV